MPLIAFINKNNYEVKDELEDYIYCDYEIRNVIANLNKKGYKTNYSCAGHNEVGIFWPTHKEDIYNLEEYLRAEKADNALHFIKKEDKYFYHKDEKTSTYIYIAFADQYEFKTYPKGFIYEIYEGKSYLSKKINFYKDRNHLNRKNDEEIFEELNESHNILEEWVNKLPIKL